MSEKVEKWQKIGGGAMRLLNGKRIKPNERFEAKESDIPSMDLVKKIGSGGMKRKGKETKQKEEPIETKKPEYTAKKRETSNYYDVVNEDGKAINEKALTKEKADELVEQMNE